MPVQNSMGSLTAVAASSSPAGTESISNNLDDYLRAISSILRHTEARGATLAAATSMSTVAATGAYIPVSGTATITHLGTGEAGIKRTLRFLDTAQLDPSANLLLPASATIVTAAGDVAAFRSEGAGVWRCTNYLVGSAAYDGGLGSLQASIDAVSDTVSVVAATLAALTDWTLVQTADSSYTAAAAQNLICDPDAGAIVVELPAGAADAVIGIKTSVNTSAANYVRLKPAAGEQIAGQAADDTLDVDIAQLGLTLVYDTTLGWVI